MEEIEKMFKHCYIRNYKGGREIRTADLENSIKNVRKLIEDKNLNVEIFDRDPRLSSFSIRVKSNS